MCVCERERERVKESERERERDGGPIYIHVVHFIIVMMSYQKQADGGRVRYKSGSGLVHNV